MQSGDSYRCSSGPSSKLRALAKPYRLRVQVDAEGFPFIPGRYGQIEWHCDGVNCWSCALPGQFALAVYTDRPRLFEKLWIPGVRRHQTGDSEMRAVFPPDSLELVALVIKARRRRSLSPAEARRLGMKTAYRVTSQTREPSSAAGPSGGLGGVITTVPKSFKSLLRFSQTR